MILIFVVVPSDVVLDAVASVDFEVDGDEDAVLGTVDAVAVVAFVVDGDVDEMLGISEGVTVVDEEVIVTAIVFVVVELLDTVD